MKKSICSNNPALWEGSNAPDSLKTFIVLLIFHICLVPLLLFTDTLSFRWLCLTSSSLVMKQFLNSARWRGSNAPKFSWNLLFFLNPFLRYPCTFSGLLTLLSQIDVVNGLSLLTAKPVTYLVNLSEKDYVRKKNKWWVIYSWLLNVLSSMKCIYRLAKIKAWIDENNPGDPLIPFSVALEERLISLSPEEKKEEEQKMGTTSALAKITQAGYSSLEVSEWNGIEQWSTKCRW